MQGEEGISISIIVGAQDIVNPINTSLPADEKLQQLQELSQQSQVYVRKFMDRIDAKYGTKSQDNFKKPERIIEKASRPSIRQNKPWFDVEHIRDAYRFKTVLKDMEILPQLAQELKVEGFEIVKADIDKVLDPGQWGWRAVIIDLRLPNGQLVEYYLPVKEVEATKLTKGHKLYEKWRDRNPVDFTKAEEMEYFNDTELSYALYSKAWNAYLKRTSQSKTYIEAVLEEIAQILKA